MVSLDKWGDFFLWSNLITALFHFVWKKEIMCIMLFIHFLLSKGFLFFELIEA